MKNSKMRKLTLMFLMLMASTTLVAQTLSKKPIYKGYNTQNLTVQELEVGYIYFGYQDKTYTTIVVRESFIMSDKEEAIALMDKLISILEMDKTAKDQHITDIFERVTIKRYGFAQKSIFIFNDKRKDLKLNLKAILKIKEALIKY